MRKIEYLKEQYQITKKAMFGLQDLGTIGMVAVVGVVTLGIGAKVLNDVTATFTAGSYSANIGNSGLSLLQNVGNNLGLVGTILGLGLVIGILVAAFRMRQ